MTIKFGVMVPQGWRMDLTEIPDPVEAYETMTRVAQEAEALGFDSVWLYDHFHTIPLPSQEVTMPMPAMLVGEISQPSGINSTSLKCTVNN